MGAASTLTARAAARRAATAIAVTATRATSNAMSITESILRRAGVDRCVTKPDLRRLEGVAPAVGAMVPATNGTIASAYCGVHHRASTIASSGRTGGTVRFDSHPRADRDRLLSPANGRTDGDLRET